MRFRMAHCSSTFKNVALWGIELQVLYDVFVGNDQSSGPVQWLRSVLIIRDGSPSYSLYVTSQ